MVSFPARLREACAAAGWPGAVDHLETTDSTNAELRRRRLAGARPWNALVADRQTAGRGRHGKVWESPPGHLYLSALLPPPAGGAPRWSLVPLAGGLAAAQALEALGVACRLKWPNDVVTPAGVKLAGVLAEASSGPGGIEGVVLGFGVNLGDAPAAAGVGSEAAGARDASGRAPERAALAAALLERLRHLWGLLDAGAPGALLDGWRARSLDWWGKPVQVVAGGTRLVGLARALAEDGALILEVDGTPTRIVAGEARELRPEAAQPRAG